MLFSAVDVGSNTLRLLVAEVSDSGLRPLRYERVITRLGGGVRDNGHLRSAPVEKSLAALKEFAALIKEFGVPETWCVGTSALREARNSQEFIDRTRREAKLEIEIISGEKEAELTAKGVLSAVSCPPSFVIVDIGGGSTEVIFQGEDETIGHVTVPAGVVKMVDAHMHSDPPSVGELNAVREEANFVSKFIREHISRSIGEHSVLVGTAGTINTLAAIDVGLEKFDPEKVHGHRMSLGKLRKMASFLSSLSALERSEIRGLEPERADLIIPGINLTISLMEALGFHEILVSSSGLLEGMVLELHERSPEK